MEGLPSKSLSIAAASSLYSTALVTTTPQVWNFSLLKNAGPCRFPNYLIEPKISQIDILASEVTHPADVPEKGGRRQ